MLDNIEEYIAIVEDGSHLMLLLRRTKLSFKDEPLEERKTN